MALAFEHLSIWALAFEHLALALALLPPQFTCEFNVNVHTSHITVHHEKLASAIRDSETTPNDLDTVFSLARNGHRRKVEDVLDKGFGVNTEDEFGNTLLVVAAQQVNLPLCEMLLKRQAHINRQNHQGNTPLHYAMAYDPSGDLGEYLIAQGADDTLENKWGLSPYDGISAEDA